MCAWLAQPEVHRIPRASGTNSAPRCNSAMLQGRAPAQAERPARYPQTIAILEAAGVKFINADGGGPGRRSLVYRHCNHACDWLLIQSVASERCWNSSISSIVPSGHSTSTAQRLPSPTTAKKTGFEGAMSLNPWIEPAVRSRPYRWPLAYGIQKGLEASKSAVQRDIPISFRHLSSRLSNS
jgi:hypothetical protein